MKNKGLKTILSLVITASMVTGSFVVPMAAEDEAAAAIPEGYAVLSEEEAEAVFAGADFEAVSEALEVEAFSSEEEAAGSLAAEGSEAVEDDNVRQAFSVSSDSSDGEGRFFGRVPMSVQPVHHKVQPIEDPALGGEETARSYMSDAWNKVIKDQGYSGNCWAFSTTTALEAGLNKKKNNTGTYPSISWKNLSYWAYRKSDQTGDDTADYWEQLYFPETYVSGLHNCISDDTYYHFAGGNSFQAALMFSQYRAMKDNAGADDGSKIDLSSVDTIYSTNTPAGSSYSDKYRVIDSYLLSGDPDQKANVKAMLVKYGAGTISYYYDRDKNTNTKTGAVYNSAAPKGTDPSVDYANHQITLVGWDDDYPVSNFLTAPKGPGAWICANSWGTGADTTDKGLTYISYYDDSIVNAGIDFHDVYSKDDPEGAEYFYDNNLGTNGVRFYGSQKTDQAFGLAVTADAPQTLKAISVFSAEDNAGYTVSVYGNPVVQNGAVDISGAANTPIVTQHVSVPFAGFHTVKLDKPVGLGVGQSVVISVKPDKEVLLVRTYDEEYVDKSPLVDETLKTYSGNIHWHAETSMKNLVEDNAGTLNKSANADFYLRAFTNNDIETGALTFSGNDFDMSKVYSASEAANTVTVGNDYYQVTCSSTPFYTGYKHMPVSVSKKSSTNDLVFVVKKNGKPLVEGTDYTLKLKNNKFPSGYKNKTPQVVLNLGKSADKEAKAQLKKSPFSFKIAPGGVNGYVKTLHYVVKVTPTEKKIASYWFEDFNGKKLKYSYAKNGKFKPDQYSFDGYRPNTKKDVEITLIKNLSNGGLYAYVAGNGTTVTGYGLYGPLVY